jgi:hypothetical protein
MSISVKDGSGNPQTVETLPAKGRASAANSLPVVLSNEDTLLAGAIANVSSPTRIEGNSTMLSTDLHGSQRTLLMDSGGAQSGTIKAASTAPLATDPALVVAISPNGQNSNGQAAMSGSLPVVIASNQTAIPVSGAVSSSPKSTSNGTTSSRVVSAASTNATNLKTSAGTIAQVDLFNVAAYDVFLKFYNKASAPTVGTDTPVWTIPIKTGTGYSNGFIFGKYFSTGISFAITKLQADSDTTVIAAGDVTGSIDWI